ncbi:MAG: Mur ligase family protein, partial [Acidimicrobiales bacterium]
MSDRPASRKSGPVPPPPEGHPRRSRPLRAARDRRPVLVVGLAVTGEAVARHLLAEDRAVVATDDRPDASVRRRARELGVPLVEAPTPALYAELGRGVSAVVVSPGVPAGHPALSLPGPVLSEVELAARVAGERDVPLVAVTGTNGKTTVTTLVARMLVAAGRRAVAAGNIGVPLIEAVSGPAEVVVAEVSSFQLALSQSFRPAVGVWLNLAEDHLDWHPSLDHYVAAKARIWANQGPGDVAVANADDPVVMGAAEASPGSGRLVTFGLGGPAGSGAEAGGSGVSG